MNFGRSNSYKVFGSTKSIAGSATVFVVSLSILVIKTTVAHAHISYGVLIFASLVATAVENVAIYGLDNLFLPIVVAVILSRV